MRLCISLLTLTFALKLFAGLPIDLNFEEMRELYLKEQSIQLKSAKSLETESMAKEIKLSINLGENLYRWIKFINDNREEDQKLRLTSNAPSDNKGIPVDRPIKYGEKTITKEYRRVVATFPKDFIYTLLGITEINEETKISEFLFIKYAKVVSVLYQRATRYSMLIKWKDHYTKMAGRDITYFYHLKMIPNLDEYLRNYSTLSAIEKDKTKKSLLKLCIKGNKKESYCVPYLEKFIKSDRLVAYKNMFWRFSEALWDSFFKISSPRKDVVWKNDTLIIPFYNPRSFKISNWLKSNVEDEFKWEASQWKLDIDFVDKKTSDTAYIKFEPNQTPHVAGGNELVMDANTDIEEYSNRWTIRHEFGHILRLPDCYHEFYDPKEKVFINYQLDVTDLMCSRSGKMNQRIFDELKRVYGSKSSYF